MTAIFANLTTSQYAIDFGEKKDGKDWYVVNDAVMGGRSASNISLTKNSLIFKGNVSLENNGGFASVRSERKELDLSPYKTVTIRFRSKSKERTFALRLNTNDVYYRPSYNQNFQSITSDWQEVTFNLADFKETRLGNFTGRTIDQEKLERVIRIGIMLNDKKQGDFELEVDSIIFQ
ncbi:MAG: CIA30 family protein [Flavobacteriaceae bacterium]|nr:CIA30 family protein [Flavobacteriaceae bacterium]